MLPLPARLARTGDHALGGPLAIAQRAPACSWRRVRGSGLTRFSTLRRAMCAFAPTLVHSNGIKTHLLSALAPLRGVPLVWHVRDFIGERAVMAHVLRAVSWRPAALVAISRSVADDIARALGREDAVVVYNGIDTSRFTPEGERVDLDALAGLSRQPGGGRCAWGSSRRTRGGRGRRIFLEAAARGLSEA